MESLFANLSIEATLSDDEDDTSEADIPQRRDPNHIPALTVVPSARGSLDLPGELRNVVYRLLCDQFVFFAPHLTPRGLIRGSIRISNKLNPIRPLALVASNTQIGQEFLTLLIFGDSNPASNTAEGLARYGPRSLTNLAYVPEFCIFSDMNISAVHCNSPAGRTTSEHEDKCAACVNKRGIGISFTAHYYIGHHIRLSDQDDYIKLTNHIRAAFSFKIDKDYELTQKSRSLINATLTQIFKTNKDVSISSLVIATDRIMTLCLEALLLESREDAPFHQVLFEFRRGPHDGHPELRVTPQRDARLLRDRED